MTSAEVASAQAYTAKPFLKWAGGKTQLLAQFAEYYPQQLVEHQIDRYVEPFLGGGAMFLDVAQRFPISESVLFDINEELILVYRVIQKYPHLLLEILRKHHDRYYSLSEQRRETYFYRIRDEYNAQRTLVDHSEFSDAWILRSAHLIFLNKTCFNGLYRVNAQGRFNVPFGRYKRPSILDEQNILCVSSLLQMADLHVGSFQECEQFVTDNAFVYFDPPYRPISSTSSFTSYSKDRFNDDDQIKLARFFAHLDQTTRAKLMLSNSDPQNRDPNDDFFESLYAGYNIHRVFANRMINSNGNGRGKITELLITNYAQ